MEITCDQCKTKLNVPDDKIPKDRMIRITCPKCKNKITVDANISAQNEPSPEVSLPDTDEALDFYDEDAKLALVLAENDIAEKVKAAVEELGYKYIPSPNTRDALGKLRFHRFDIIFLAEGFDGQELANSPIHNYLNTISISARRRIFVALMGDNLKTMDEMAAYAMSSNIVISTKDTDKLLPILKKGISEYEKFYKVFMDTLVEVGKE
jgi:predicted Zn finger-like uncharacterized protein